jgi:hypothetical protein
VPVILCHRASSGQRAVCSRSDDQVEQWFSIVQRKRLTIADFADKALWRKALDGSFGAQAGAHKCSGVGHLAGAVGREGGKCEQSPWFVAALDDTHPSSRLARKQRRSRNLGRAVMDPTIMAKGFMGPFAAEARGKSVAEIGTISGVANAYVA